MFSGREEDFYVWAKKDESYVSGVFLNVRGALSLAEAASAVALGVPEFNAETSAERDGQLLIVLRQPSRTVGGSAGDRGFESWRKLHGRTCTKSPEREILSPPRAKLPELVGAIERLEDLVRRHCGRRDAQGNILADDIRRS